MIRDILPDHPQRQALTDELHARPAPELGAPGRALFIALQAPDAAAVRDAEADRAHLAGIIARHGGTPPEAEADQYLAELDGFRLKWERHTEFVSYTLYEEGPAGRLFDAALARHFPEDWLAAAPGRLIVAIEVEVVHVEALEAAEAFLEETLGPVLARDSLAAARVIDGNALAAGDFRVQPDGFTRFAMIVHGPAGPRRIGRVVQRLIEIESYRTLAMLALPVARRTAARINQIEGELGALVAQAARGRDAPPDAELLDRLTRQSADLEELAVASAFRFGAGAAYEAIVHERIAMLREQRLEGRQLFSEFMNRRFQQAMRTCHAAQRRLGELAARASRTAELLRTRVSVAVEAQNQELLASMNRRAAMQLRLQQTVEGLSVVAISYYGVSLMGYLLGPLAGRIGLAKGELTAAAVLPVVALVWWSVRRIRKRVDSKE
ncbi:MAG TPA: DUF3422 domain-containing protein [Thermohalobaculum sp.]|nr:DUF3422 domain-containing protein [Thermohalobaculum sp.]